MESQFLIMQLQKLTFPIKDISEHQLIFFDFDDPRFIPFRNENKANNRNLCVESSDFQSVLEFDDFGDLQERSIPKFSRKYFVNEKGIIEYVDPFCNDCYSRKVVKWNHTTRFWISDGFQGNVKIQRYKCKSCGKLFQTEFEGQFERGCNFSEQLKEKAILTKELNWSSHEDISSYYKIFNGIDISPETVRKSILVIEGNEIQYDVPKVSGYFGYDCQWVKINKEWKYRHVLFDLVQEIPIAEIYTDEDNNNIVYEFIDNNTERRDRIGIVTDLKHGYDKIMRKLKFKRHQYCIFHFKLSINKLIREHLRDLRIEQTQIIKNTYKNPSQKFIEDEIEKLVKDEKREIRYALEILYYLFKEKTFSKALSYVKLIKSNLVIFPEFLRKHLEDNFMPIYKSFLYHLEFPHKGKLDRTNNQTEGYFRSTMPKGQKRKYRSLEGIINQNYHKGNGWIKNKRKKKNVTQLF